MTAALPVTVLRATELFATELPALPGAREPGGARAAYRGLATPHFWTNVVVIPGLQRSTPRASEVDHVIMILDGSVEFSVDGRASTLRRWDQILVPAMVDWEYRNPAEQEATFVSVVSDPA